VRIVQEKITKEPEIEAGSPPKYIQNRPIGSNADSMQAKYRRPSGELISMALLILPEFSIFLAEDARYRARRRSW
jgi:hypothetical protein